MSFPTPGSGYHGDSSLGVGQIISDAFTLGTRNYVGVFFLYLPILIATVAALGPAFLAAFSQDQQALQAMIEENITRFFLLEALVFVVWLICSCAMTRLLHDRYVGAPQSATSSAINGASRSLSAFGLLLILTIAYVVFAIVLALILTFLNFILGAFTVVVAIGLVIFGLYLAFPYIFAGIVCVVEGLGPLSSLNRSKFLTEGYRWPLFGMILISFLILALIQLILFGIGSLMGYIAYGRTVLLIASALLYPLFTGWMIGIYVIACYRLRYLKDGVMPGQTLANVFD